MFRNWLGNLVAFSRRPCKPTPAQFALRSRLRVEELIASQNYLQCATVATFDDIDGAEPIGNLVVKGNGDIFGTTAIGGNIQFGNGDGVLFKVPLDTNTTPYSYDEGITVVAMFDYDSTGSTPLGGLVADASGNLYGTTSNGPLGGTLFEVQSGSSTITTLATFGYGATPSSPLTMIGNALFGSTYYGNGWGTVYEFSNGTINTLGTFDPSSNNNSYPAPGLYGYYPLAAPFIDSNGNLFGVASYGGTNNDGTVYEITLGAYSQTIEAIGGSGPLTFSTTAGSLPPGLVLSSTGVISGIPTTSGSYTFTVTVTDALGDSTSMTYTLNISF